MSNKLSIVLIQNHLIEADEAKKVAVQKQALSKHRKATTVKVPKDPSSKLTKISQVEVPTGSGTKKPSKSTNGQTPTADFAGTYVDKMPKPVMSQSKGEKSPPTPKIVSDSPNQTSKMKEIKKTVKNIEGGKEGGTSMPSADFADTYTRKMPHGSKTLGSSGGASEMKAPKVEKMSSTTSPNGNKVKNPGVKEMDKKSIPQINANKQGDLPTPSDAPKRTTWKTMKKGHNVVEGVQVRIAGSNKVKAEFAVVSESVLQNMKENYSKHGYDLEFSPCRSSWKDDTTFLRSLTESMDAKYNFVPKYHKIIRNEALKRFASLCKGSYSDNLYESRKDFTNVVLEAFELIMEKAEQKYVDSLDLYECNVRVELNEDVVDMEIVSEASNHAMALRQVRNIIQEEYGLATNIVHVFVDGKKYKPSEIKTWSRK